MLRDKLIAQIPKQVLENKRTKGIISALESAEAKALKLAKEQDEGDRDLAKPLPDSVVLENEREVNSDYSSTLAVQRSGDSYTIESVSDKEYDSWEEMLSIQKDGDRTTYRLKRGGDRTSNGYKLPDEEIRNLLLIKDQVPGAEPEYEMLEGRWAITKHKIGKLFNKLSNVRIVVGE